jgi:hypothetical protein
VRMPVHPQHPKDPSLVPMQIEIATIPSRDWPWFAKSLVLGTLFLFILVFEIAGLMGFGWLGVRGALGLQDQHWIGTGMALIAAVGLGFAIYHQLPLMVGEISGRYTLQITHDSVALRLRFLGAVLVSRIHLCEPTNVFALQFLPGMTLIMVQNKDRLSFGLTLPPDEIVRLQGLIRTSLLAHSAPCSPSVPTRTSEQIGSE